MTSQVQDTLVVDGERYRIVAPSDTLPLERAFSGPDGRPRPRFQAPDSAVWRGYVADWLVENRRLYLVGFKGWVDGASGNDGLVEVGLHDVFRAEVIAGTGRVFAGWFSGELPVRRVPDYSDEPSEVEPVDRILFVERGGVVGDTAVPEGRSDLP